MNSVVYNPRINTLPGRVSAARCGEPTCVCAPEEETQAPALLEAFDWMGASRHEFSLPTLTK